MDIDKARSLLGVVKEYDRVSELDWAAFTASRQMAGKWVHEVFGARIHPDEEAAAKEMEESIRKTIETALLNHIKARRAEIQNYLKTEYGVTVEDPNNGNRVLWLDEASVTQ